ncbi:hypothetical protein TSAR_016053 [Trichomalopsis sarcophagae]|uniref:HMG box domain-containing protein n=1 Tax=Trichomalopsis sarcophagae TaxID=543379 RepID=A0A232EH54_9HYME|nr:hypothetical protein TSAR_016053 [Trichomalopsis sarcophagae]
MAANEHQQREEEDGHEPAHHARRPMNAFLIFCKRHRAAVRSGFPHLENRAVTRVLGEWWAMLSTEQKKAYTNLAQEYKDAFLNANPDFKWYKLPAPPLRTLNTRPTNKKTDGGLSDSGSETIKSDYLTLNVSKLDEDSIQPGKLADESQLGGLSSLFTPQKVNPQDCQSSTNNFVSEDEANDNSEVPKPPKKRYTELPISAESKEDCKADLFGDKKSRTESNNNDHHLMNVDEDENDETHTYIEDTSVEDSAFRAGRSCKGLRYQKFLAEQLATHQAKQRRIAGLPNIEHNRERRNSISSNVSEKTDSLSSEGTSSRGDLEHLVQGGEGNLEASKPEDTETEGAEGHATWMSRKRFKAEDFNLEKKIEALPSLSLEEFQAMKKQQRTKKKKILQKVSGSSKKPYRDNSPGRKTDMQKESEKALLVGSQKRKARKQSITRNTLTVDSPIVKEEQEPNKAWCESPDLEALACLAAVAANRTKLTKS